MTYDNVPELARADTKSGWSVLAALQRRPRGPYKERRLLSMLQDQHQTDLDLLAELVARYPTDAQRLVAEARTSDS